MPLEAGTRLGPYEIIDLLGAGGMGEVYRARDTRLDRNVALKISAQQFTDRFSREAKVISSLNHPRICTLHDVGPNFLVMELVEGETLAERIAHGPIALDEALPLARQIVEGLEAAHEKGVIHRDLKPANIKITPDGDIKVLDFGLAKVAEAAAAQASSDPAASPTLTIQATRAGLILGTAAYMPPEQARGAVVDRRADSWAFGCVLYEMLTAKRVFDGESTTDVLAAVVRAEPDWSTLPVDTPPPIRRLLKRCLEKDRKRRLPDIGVARLEIDDAMLPVETSAVAVAAPARRSPAPWIAAAAVAILAVAGAIWWALRVPTQEVWTGTLLGGSRSAFGPRLSPDGQLLAFLSFEDRLPQLAVMKPNGGSWTILTHDRTHGYVSTAAWAPDGSRIYFDRSHGQPLGVYSIPPLGGEPRLLLEDAYGPEPLVDGSLIVAKLADRGDMQLFHFWPESGKLEPLPAYMPLTDVDTSDAGLPQRKGSSLLRHDRGTALAECAFFDSAIWLPAKARELKSDISLTQGTTWAPLEVSRDGEFVYALAQQQDTRLLMELPVHSARKPRPILSFPRTGQPMSMDIARDGSIYTDQLTQPNSLLSVAETGGAIREFPIPPFGNGSILRGGKALIPGKTNGKSRLDLYTPGGEFREVFESSEECAVPAAITGDYLAFQIGTGAAQRTALAGLRDGRLIRRYLHRSDSGMSATPDGKTLYYAFEGSVWAQPVEGGDPKRVTPGIDVALDPAGRFLYVKRAGKGVLTVVRMPVDGGAEETLPLSPEYRIANPAFAESAVDARGRMLVSVISKHSFFYDAAILDPAAKTFTVLPISFEGDVASSGWTPDGRVLARGQRYLTALWRYQRSAGFK